MKRTGTIDLPLHGGKCPPWLFRYMSRLSAVLLEVIIYEYGTEELLRRLADPYFFQSLGCLLGFDWHSSGLTTTVCGALKDGLKGKEKAFGLYIAGGKGATSRKTPRQIVDFLEKTNWSLEPEKLVYTSRITAKVDNNAVQDGYQLYHHNLLFDKSGSWAVIQQGMRQENSYARRYHWWSGGVKSFVIDPHQAICGSQEQLVLDLTARKSIPAQETSVVIAQDHPIKTLKEIKRLKISRLPRHHQVLLQDINPQRLERILVQTYEQKYPDYEHLLAAPGVGPKTIRALALLSDLVYGKSPSRRDPVSFSFAHGGKDGHPYPVNRKNYQQSIDILSRAVKEAKLGRSDKLRALRRLSQASPRPFG